MSLDLLNHRFLVVTGKGGVGKSSVAAALGVCAAEQGLRTLVCELDAKGDLARLLGSEPVGYSGSEVRPGLVAMTMDTERSLSEYLRVQAKIPFTGLIRPLAGVLEFVATAAPGVREVLTIGKLAWEVRRSNFDLVIADASASGHVIGQLSAPAAIRELVQFGMIRSQLDWMIEILEDPEITSAIVVTTPEEMPVVETIELSQRVQSEARINLAAAVVNRVLPAPFTVTERSIFDELARVSSTTSSRQSANLLPALEATAHALRRRETGSKHLVRLRSELPTGLPMLLLPELLMRGDDPTAVQQLATALAAEANWGVGHG